MAPHTADLVLEYLDGRVSRRDLDPMTARNHRSALTIFASIAGPDPTGITCTEVERWLANRSGLAQATLRSQFSMVRTFCQWLVARGYLDRNPTSMVPAPRLPRSVPRALELDAISSLLHECRDTRARAIVRLMVNMGLRCVEVHRLELGDWDRGRGTMRIVGKGGHERVLPVPVEVADTLNAYLFEHPASSGPLIRSYRQNRALAADTLSGMVSEWLRAAHVKMVPRDGVAAHALRHTAASDVLDECGDLRIVQAMLGHRNLATTSIYLRRANLGDMRRAMEGRRYEAAS